MIRDPSDGSVKETVDGKDIAIAKEQYRRAVDRLNHTTDREIASSGLPTASTKPQMIAKLEKSREWLKNYHGRKGTK